MTEECFKEAGAERLLELADILDVADEEHDKRGQPRYYQQLWRHSCGTPACALGHWTSAHSERITWNPNSANLRRRDADFPQFVDAEGKRWTGTNAAMAEFCLEQLESIELFGGFGCNNAKTGKQAAAYIRAFVERKLLCGS